MKAPEIKTQLPGPRARAIIDKDAKFVSPSYTRDYPLVIARGEGAVVEDVDGNVFVDCAAGIKLSRYYTRRPNVIAFLGSFHGRSLGALALTASKSIQRRGFGPLMSGVYHAPYPDTYRFSGSADACAAAS